MKVANNANVTFWGALIMSQTAPHIWAQWFFLAFAAFIVYRVYKEDDEQRKTDLDNAGRGEHGCANGACKQSSQPEQPSDSAKTTKVSCG
jgi:hypothetical protein